MCMGYMGPDNAAISASVRGRMARSPAFAKSSCYKLVKSNSDCQPSGDWIGKMSVHDCLLRCPTGFVHATGTNGDQNCKCVDPTTCTQISDSKLGLNLYAATGDAGEGGVS